MSSVVMDYIDLTEEIYHGHEQEYLPECSPLSVTDSAPSLPRIWRNAQLPSNSDCKPVCILYITYVYIYK